jgi:serine/threonine protein kinase
MRLDGIGAMDGSSIDYQRYSLSPDQFGLIWEVEVSFEREWHPGIRVAAYLERVPATPQSLRAALEELLTQVDRIRRHGLGSTCPSGSPAPDAGHLPECPGPFGEFHLENELGRGTFGVVYRARWESRGQDVALKILSPGWTHQPKARQLFLRESRLAATLNHPHIVPVYGAGEQDGLLFIIYQLVEGVSLAKSPWMRPDRPDPVRAVREILLPVLEAVHAAHHVGVVHRDLKPANILLDQEGRPFVSDFGMGATDREMAWGRVEGFAGTLYYMAPEQLRNEGQRVGERTDIYAVGVILYELLTGVRPFEARTADELIRLATEREPRSPRTINPEIPRALNQACLRAMQREIADRYVDCDEFMENLRKAIEPPATDRSRTADRPGGGIGVWRRRAVTAALLLALTLALAVPTWKIIRSPAEHPRVVDARLTHYPIILVEGKKRHREARALGGGVEPSPVLEQDAVRVGFQLNASAYCYLIALNTDGKDQLCWPEDGSVPPKRTSSVEFPDSEGHGYSLTDGPGLQSFLLVVSEEPLPPYTQWRAQLGRIDWHGRVTGEEGVWRYDGHRPEPLALGPRVRGQVEPLADPPTAFRSLCERLERIPGVAAVGAVAFPVQARAGGATSG